MSVRIPSSAALIAACLLALDAFEPAPALAAGAATRLDFNRDVRPILSDACFQCHGPDEQKRKGGLRLDVKDQAFKPAKSGKLPIVAGQPEQSELLRRVQEADPDSVMPPPSSHKTLNAAQIDTLRRWIADGAVYQQNWAFVKPDRPPVPNIVGPNRRVVNAIDAFVIERLDKEQLKPAPETTRETLIRRVSLDLTGLPPTPAEVEAFLADERPGAYERLVDRLLASHAYGERMAAQWLDFARYADSNGFQSDSSRQMWHWREWVINAFNRNLPFDQFTIEQLAGDLLPGATTDQVVATGFNRNTRLNGEGGRIAEEWFAETIIDRVETTGQTWLALTLGCCRCHDHKFDPITQREFYQIYAFFNSCNESGVLDGDGSNSKPVLPLPTPEQTARLSELEKGIQAANDRAKEAGGKLSALQAEWEPRFRAQLKSEAPAWVTLAPTAVRSLGGATLTRQPDGTWLAGGKNPDNDVYEIEAPIAPGTFSGVMLEAFPDPSLPNQSLGRYGNGNFVLTDVDAEVIVPGSAEPLLARIVRAEADYEQKGYEVRRIVQDKSKRARGDKNGGGWAIDGNDTSKRLPRRAIFVAEAPLTVPPGATLKVTLRHDAIAGHNVGRFRISATGLPPSAVRLDGAKVPDDVLTALDTEPSKRPPAARDALAKFYRENTDNPVRRAESEAASLKQKLEEVRGRISNTMVMEELPKPRESRVLIRGEYDKPGDKVERGLPAALPSLPPGAPMNRLGFAQWLVSGEHPLTARVWVNRAWERFFGLGLVRTTENMGSQAEWPSHPELLDWLATEFVRVGWDMKAMQKLMVMSATYRQASRVTPELAERDPENRLLARGPRFRLTAEQLRDQALAVSGLLVDQFGGPSVRPYMPAGVWDETSVYGDLRNYKSDTGSGLYRRTLYTVWKRTAAPPTMLLFDSPTREICTVKRSRTDTPLQALALLNEVTYVEAARKLAERMIAEGGATASDRIAWAFRRATARHPDAKELATLSRGLERRLTHYRTAVDEARKLVRVGTAPLPGQFDLSELAAYTLTANVLLNLDETVTRE